MREIIVKISRVLQVVLMAPIKLPGKALDIVKYIALGLGVIETVLDKRQEEETGKNLSAEKEDQQEKSIPKELLDQEEPQKFLLVVETDPKIKDDHRERLQEQERQLFDQLYRAELQPDGGIGSTLKRSQDMLDQDVGFVKDKTNESEKRKEGMNENQ